MAELFANFEVNREVRRPVILKLLGASLAAHLLAIACVIYIPGVRNAFNIASLIAGTTFVEKPYARTKIGDDVELVQLTSEKFHYPEGYFALASQSCALILPPPPAARIIAQAQPAKASQPEAAPTSSPSPIATPSPAAVAIGSQPQTMGQANATPSPKYEGDRMSPDEAQRELERTAAQNNIELPKEGEINKQAMK